MQVAITPQKRGHNDDEITTQAGSPRRSIEESPASVCAPPVGIKRAKSSAGLDTASNAGTEVLELDA